MTAINRLRLLRACLDSGDPVPADLAKWATVALRRYEQEAPGGLELGRAFGLVPGPGQESWWTIEERHRRDLRIRRYHKQFFGHLGIPQAAQEIAADAHRKRPVPNHRKPFLTEMVKTDQRFPSKHRIVMILKNEIPPIDFTP